MAHYAPLTAPVYVRFMRTLATVLVVLACVPALTSGAEGRSSQDGGLRFHEIGLVGHHRRMLSSHAISFGFYDLSPDRKQLAFVDPYVYGPLPPGLLWVVDLRRPGQALLLDAKKVGHGLGSIFAVAWSPDGKRIAVSIGYTSLQPDEGIWVINPDGSGLRQVTVPESANDVPRHLSWSPDSTQLAFSNRADVSTVVSVDTGATREVGHGALPLWSPDGRSLLVQAGGLAILPLSGGPPRFLADGGSPVWSPNGKQIAFTRGTANGASTLWTVASRGGRPHPVADRAYGPVWSRDSRRIAFEHHRGCCRSRLRIAALKDHRIRQITTMKGRRITPLAWSARDRSTIYFSEPIYNGG
jgi:Tol biopolymer transport system component